MATLREQLDESQIHPAIRDTIRNAHTDIVEQVKKAVLAHDVVVVGMAVNPHVKKARRLLDAANIRHEYLEYGGYLSQWRRRNALKQWTGWPTFPMIFVKGIFVGGAADLAKLIESDALSVL